MVRTIGAWLVRGFPLNVFGPVGGQLGKFYNTNDVFKYPVGQRIRVVARNIVGFGVNARGVIVGHTTNQWGENAYMVEMTNDKGVLFVDWMKTGTIPAGAIAETNKQRHFKWNIEHHFVADDSAPMGS